MKLGRIPKGGGWRAHGRKNREATNDRSTRPGYDYVHPMINDHSRLAYSEDLTDEKSPTSAGFLTRAIAYLAARGITRIERLMTDNAWAYRYSLREVCAEHNITQKFIRPHRPCRTARSRDSTGPWPPSGPTARSSPPTT